MRFISHRYNTAHSRACQRPSASRLEGRSGEHTLRRQAGYGLIDIMLVLVAIFTLVAIVFNLNAEANQRMDIGKTQALVLEITTRIKDYGSATDGYTDGAAALTTGDLVAVGVVPAAALDAADVPRDPWGHEIEISAFLDHYTITLNQVPDDACGSLVAGLILHAAQVEVNGADVRGGFASMSYDPAVLAQACVSRNRDTVTLTIGPP